MGTIDIETLIEFLRSQASSGPPPAPHVPPGVPATPPRRGFAELEEGHNIPGHPHKRKYVVTQDGRAWIEDDWEDAIPFGAQVTWIWLDGRANLSVKDYWGREFTLERVPRTFAPVILREMAEAGTGEETPDASPPEAMAHLRIGDIVGYSPKMQAFFHPIQEGEE